MKKTKRENKKKKETERDKIELKTIMKRKKNIK